MIFLILIAMSVFAGTPAYSSVKSSISEIQIVLDKENGNSYTYAKVYLSDASTDLWVLPLQMNGNDTYSNGGKLLLTQLEQAFSSGNAIIIQGTEMWGLGANADYTATFTGKRIGRTGGQITCV